MKAINIYMHFYLLVQIIYIYMPVHIYIKYNDKVREIHTGSHYR